MIPKDSNSNHYLKESQAEKKDDLGPSAADGRTVRPYQADHPWVPHGLFARVTKARRATGCSGGNFGPSAPGCRTIRAPSGLSAGASRTVCVCHTQVGPGPRVAKSSRQSLSSYSLSQERNPLGDFDWSYPRTVRAHPRNHHHVIRVFYRISHLFTQIEQEGG
jgi:hypothetical protein